MAVLVQAVDSATQIAWKRQMFVEVTVRCEHTRAGLTNFVNAFRMGVGPTEVLS